MSEKNTLIHKGYVNKSNSSSLGNPNSNLILERIHLVLGKLVQTYKIQETYVNMDDQWMGILVSGVFGTLSSRNMIEYFTPGQLVFSCDIINPSKHNSDW